MLFMNKHIFLGITCCPLSNVYFKNLFLYPMILKHKFFLIIIMHFLTALNSFSFSKYQVLAASEKCFSTKGLESSEMPEGVFLVFMKLRPGIVYFLHFPTVLNSFWFSKYQALAASEWCFSTKGLGSSELIVLKVWLTSLWLHSSANMHLSASTQSASSLSFQ